jgi:hypothetical protein
MIDAKLFELFQSDQQLKQIMLDFLDCEIIKISLDME